jgi:hypothetical protein
VPVAVGTLQQPPSAGRQVVGHSRAVNAQCGHVDTARSSPEDESPWDCITEMTFTDHQAMRRWGVWYDSDDGQVLRDDELRFMDNSKRLIIITEPR